MADEMPNRATGVGPIPPWSASSLQKREWQLRAYSMAGGEPETRESWLIDRAAAWGYNRGREQGDVDAAAAADAELEACREFLEHRGQHHLAKALMEVRRRVEPDRSDEADAARLRWILNGNGYFLEEYGLCGHGPGEEDEARREIDKRMAGTE